MSDWFDAAIDDVGKAGRQVSDAVQRTVDLAESYRETRRRGVPLPEMVDEAIASGIRDVRLAATDAFHDFERAVACLRGGIVRTLVDEHGMTFTDVAARLLVSRQVVAKLYEQACDRDVSPDMP